MQKSGSRADQREGWIVAGNLCLYTALQFIFFKLFLSCLKALS